MQPRLGSTGLGTRTGTGLAWHGMGLNGLATVASSSSWPSSPSHTALRPRNLSYASVSVSQSSLYFSKEPASHALRMRSRRLPLASLLPPPSPTLSSSTLGPAGLSIFSPSHIRVIKSLSSVAALAAVKIPKKAAPQGSCPAPPTAPLPLSCFPSLLRKYFP